MSDSKNYNMGCAQYHFIIKWERYVKAGPEDTRNCISKWHKLPWNPLLVHGLSSLNITYGLWCSLWSVDWGRKKNRSSLMTFLPKILAEFETGCLQCYNSTQVCLWRTVLKRNLPSGQNSKYYTWLVYMPGRRDEQSYCSTLIHEQSLTIWTWKEDDWRIWRHWVLEKRYEERPLWKSTEFDICVPGEC